MFTSKRMIVQNTKMRNIVNTFAIPLFDGINILHAFSEIERLWLNYCV
jgi:hypothetical protein